MTANTAATDLRSPARPAGAELYTRLLAAFLIPFLAAAFILLYLLPGTTEALFAWTIEPPLTAMFLASAYLGGIWFFAAAARAHNWRAVNRGIPAVLVFATLLLIATLLHLDKFHPGHISFIVWFALYLTTPALVVILMIVNRHTDDGTDAPRDYRVPLPTRIVLAAIGVASLATGLALFFQADALIAAWPWTLTPLTAQVMGAALTLPGIVNLALLRDPRWSAFRTVFQAQIVSLVAIVLALIIRAADLKPAPSSIVFCAGIGLSLVAYVLFYLHNERRSGSSSGSSSSPPPQ
jgi:hypothetical protein